MNERPTENQEALKLLERAFDVVAKQATVAQNIVDLNENFKSHKNDIKEEVKTLKNIMNTLPTKEDIELMLFKREDSKKEEVKKEQERIASLELEVKSAKRAGYGIATIVGFIGVDKLFNIIKNL
jgi:hypothetical protein